MANEFVNRNYKVAIMCCDPNEGKPFFFLNEKIEFINLNGTGKEYNKDRKRIIMSLRQIR